MKKTGILIYFLLFYLTDYSQTAESKSQILIPLDWKTTECGRTISGPTEECKLTVKNNTDSALQGYWVTWHGQLRKYGFARIKAKETKLLVLRSNDIWVFTDTLLNVLGSYKLTPGNNEIVLDSDLLKNSRKLNRPIADRDLLGTISGGPSLKEQEAYDVLNYDLNLEILPDQKYIQGSNIITAKTLTGMRYFVFDLDPLFQINQVALKISDTYVELPYELKNNKYWATLPSAISNNQIFKIRIAYEGNPRESTHAPYKGGFSWNRTIDCEHWIATSCQMDGADVWFPCKDYQWDEADTVDLSFTVPQGLSAISNGVMIDSINNENGTTTFNWKVLNPINNYGIALNIAPYEYISDKFTSVTGDVIDLGYWVLPENLEKAKIFYPYAKKYIQFLESHLGPYPFRNEKLGIVEVPFVGMEHQTIIALGLDYQLQYPEYNKTLFHEICHEWFGNLATASDWSGFWIHESLDAYMEALYEESIAGPEAYLKRINRFQKALKNKIPLAPINSSNSREVYSGDSYSKGAFLLHTLRFLIGKENLLQVIRRMAYPDPKKESITDGTQCHFTSTEQFFSTLESISKQSFDWFEKVYFRNAQLPILEISEKSDGVRFTWITVGDIEFNMPIEIKTKKGVLKIEFDNNISDLNIEKNNIIEIDPNNWVLKKVRGLTF